MESPRYGSSGNGGNLNLEKGPLKNSGGALRQEVPSIELYLRTTQRKRLINFFTNFLFFGLS
jgi:hypothetical protein